MKRIILLAAAALSLAASLTASPLPKREFRGAWLQTVYQDGFKKRTTEQNKAYLREQLDRLHLAGINAVLFQVRPSADAFYKSDIEPWSRFLTDAGKAPAPFWDPLEFMVEECHARGMELHAWINPYRVTTSSKDVLPKGHLYHKHPERFIRFDNKIYFDPGRPENREHIAKVVTDIVRRYDIDGIHFDDYFYPYPVKGRKFNDDASFRKYGKGMKLADWRRRNVDLLIEELHAAIPAVKPWVRFGISPFGIWRNKASDSRGSETRGLQNYDDLYADVVMWAEKGWIDYLIPQLYWTLENKIASSEILADWWGRNCSNRHVYVGQNVKVTMDNPAPARKEKSQLAKKVEITRLNPAIQGNCWWSGYDLTVNHAGVADSLSSRHHPCIALPPVYPWISTARPGKPRNVRINNGVLSWDKPKTGGKADDAVMFAVYCFTPGMKADIENAEALVTLTDSDNFTLKDFPKGSRYVVTSISRANVESEPTKELKF